jgi:hypothetical protein
MPKRSTWPILLALTLLAALALPGCGSSDSSSTPSITKAQLIKQGDAICLKADNLEFEESVEWEQQHLEELKGLSQGARVAKILLKSGIPSIIDEKEKLEALGVPAGDEAQLEAFFNSIDAAIVKARKNPLAMNVPTGPFAPVDSLARKYGFKACSEFA